MIHSFISGATPSWEVDGNRWLRYPTTSKIPHDTTHPAFLRTLRIDPSGLDGFQTTINSAGEFDIYDDLNTVTGNGAFLIDWDAFFTQPGETVERDVQTSLVQVIESIGRALGIRVRAKLDEPMAVGGILALHELDIHGNTDIVIYNNDNDPLLAIEVKTPRTFDGDRWYRDFRATQILTPLYHFNVPTFLATQEQFKLFYENSERDAVYTYPCRTDRHSYVLNTMTTCSMGTQFVQAVIICLRARPATQEMDAKIRRCMRGKFITTAKQDKTTSPERSIKRGRGVKQPIFNVEGSGGLIETIEVRLYDDEDIKLFGIPPESD